jgi:hypothetical protein
MFSAPSNAKVYYGGKRGRLSVVLAFIEMSIGNAVSMKTYTLRNIANLINQIILESPTDVDADSALQAAVKLLKRYLGNTENMQRYLI